GAGLVQHPEPSERAHAKRSCEHVDPLRPREVRTHLAHRDHALPDRCRGWQGEDPRPVLRDCAAVQEQTLRARAEPEHEVVTLTDRGAECCLVDAVGVIHTSSLALGALAQPSYASTGDQPLPEMVLLREHGVPGTRESDDAADDRSM